MQFFLGIDDGNYDVKSANTTTPGGYTTSISLPALTKEYLYYDGMYYIPSTQRFDYQEDKTINERCLILTLFGIAKEMKYRAEKKKGSTQEEILKMDQLALGTGLPPLQWYLKERKEAYYKKHLGKGISFEYCGYQFNFKMNYCKIFPQAIAAILVNANNDIVKNYPRYNVCDIGGGTMDIVPFIDGSPDTANAMTFESGILFMYRQIILSAKRSLGKTITSYDVETVLKNKQTKMAEELVGFIKENIQRWVNDNIINSMVQSKINFDTTPTIFLGGSSLALKPYINKNKIISNHSFLRNPVHANAKGYEILVEECFNSDNNAA